MSDFASEYGIRLGVRDDVPWFEFLALLRGLLAADTRLWRFFTDKDGD